MSIFSNDNLECAFLFLTHFFLLGLFTRSHEFEKLNQFRRGIGDCDVSSHNYMIYKVDYAKLPIICQLYKL